MKQVFRLIFISLFFLACRVQANLYTAQNIEMSGEGTTPVEAKNNAIRTGELMGFTEMIRSLIGRQNEAFFERPTDDEILELVKDISILEEKSTSTSYRGKMNVRFKENAVQELLKKNELAYLQKATPTYWLVPVWVQGGDRWTLEDENQFYQLLKRQYPLSDSFQMVLPNGDVNELILTEQSIETQDFSKLLSEIASGKAEQVLVIEVKYGPDGRWEMGPVSYPGTENSFSGLKVYGNKETSLLDGWRQLNSKMAVRWQEKYRSSEMFSEVYYARFNLIQMGEWGQLKHDLQKLAFLENLTLQGAMPGQLLLSFTYSDGTNELIRQLDKAGFVWVPDSGTLGTLKRKEFYEGSL